MPTWIFAILLILLFLLIAAAIIVPVLLVELPKKHSTASLLAACEKKMTCSNGGINIVGTSGSCQCLCVNGFTGATCSVPSAADCTTTPVNGTKSATVGSALPRLLSGAASNYSVPLHAVTILGLFSETNISCPSENALITFNGLTARSVNFDDLEPVLSVPPQDLISTPPTRTLQRRQATTTSSDGTVTSDGIMFQAGSPSGTASASPSSMSSSNSTSTASLDFARIAVLYVLQDSGQLNNAIEAQQALQSYFSTGSIANGQVTSSNNVTLQNGYTANLARLSLIMPNGTTVGQT